MAQLGLVRLLQAEQDQVDRCAVVGCKVVVGAVIDRVPRKLPYAEVPHACGEERQVKDAAIKGITVVSVFSLWMLACWMSMAFVACSSAVDRALWTGEKTSRTPLVRLGSNIMLRLRTLTFSQPGYRLEMLTETKSKKEQTRINVWFFSHMIFHQVMVL